MPTMRGSARNNLIMSFNTLSITFIMAVLIYLDWAIFFSVLIIFILLSTFKLFLKHFPHFYFFVYPFIY